MTWLAPETIHPMVLPSVLLSDRSQLPDIPAIYFVIDGANTILYIGCTQWLQGRWQTHNRLAQCQALEALRIAWLAVSDKMLLRPIEAACIDYFAPAWNRRKMPLRAFVQIQLALPTDHYREAQYYFKLEGITFTKFVMDAIADFLEEYRAAHPESVPRGKYTELAEKA